MGFIGQWGGRLRHRTSHIAAHRCTSFRMGVELDRIGWPDLFVRASSRGVGWDLKGLGWRGFAGRVGLVDGLLFLGLTFSLLGLWSGECFYPRIPCEAERPNNLKVRYTPLYVQP